jgi:hypothetical protein
MRDRLRIVKRCEQGSTARSCEESAAPLLGPASPCCTAGGFAALFGRQLCCASLSAFETAFAPQCHSCRILLSGRTKGLIVAYGFSHDLGG